VVLNSETIFIQFQINLEKFKPAENGDKSDEESYDEEVVERPHEIEVEEVREREVLQDVVETRKIPQVRAMYPYRGQGMSVDKGEVSVFKGHSVLRRSGDRHYQNLYSSPAYKGVW